MNTSFLAIKSATYRLIRLFDFGNDLYEVISTFTIFVAASYLENGRICHEQLQNVLIALNIQDT